MTSSNPELETVTLYRPVGPQELALIEASGFRAFPPRLPEQPIFYPVCNERYACEIAERWNVPDSGSGYVTKFAVRKDYLDSFETHIVGARHHEEYWIPAEELDAFNAAIVGTIDVTRRFPDAHHGLDPDFAADLEAVQADQHPPTEGESDT